MKKTIKDGGPAFPQTISVGNLMWIEGGLTLRDYFAGQALAGMMANPKEPLFSAPPVDVAKVVGEFADAVIAELNRKDG